MPEKDHAETAKAFREAVNMAPAELEAWLKREESKSVGWADGGPKSRAGGKESIGHKSGERIVQIKRKTVAELTGDDYDHMDKVVGYIHRHLKQKPSSDVEHSRWRYSLMNWGHDPTKG